MNDAGVRPQDLFRLPWSLNDNILGWLEPTKRCNLYCEGCYSTNDKDSDKSLEQVARDLDVFVANRRMDSISIAGGDPLMHPEIADIVRMVRYTYGLKPVINTNGLALTPELLVELKKAGLFGFTFHVDSSQGRPGWKDKDEIELCELRLSLAHMVAEMGGMSVAFNATVFPHTLKHVPELVRWARAHVDLVHSMVFILFRTLRTREFDYFAGGRRIETGGMAYYDQDENPTPLTADRVVEAVREAEPDFAPCAYLGGTHDPQSFKWLLAGRFASRDRTYGWVGPRYMETVQTGHHLLRGRYLAYTSPKVLESGRAAMAAFAPIDASTRRAAERYASTWWRRPWKAPPVHFQTLVVIQPIDMMADGRANMCDGCPDMTVHDGELVWSCRLDERLRHGCFLTAAPRCKAD